MFSLEKYFINQVKSHTCELPLGDDFEYMKKVKKARNCFLISEKSLQSYLKVKTTSAIYYEKRRQVRSTQILVIHPFSVFLSFWQFFMSLVLLMSVIIFPFFYSFHGPLYVTYLFLNEKPFYTFYVILSFAFLTQIVCLTDIIVKFVTGYVNSSTDEMVIQPARIVRHYLCTYFLVDLCSSLPVDSIIVISRGLEFYSLMSHTEYIVLSVLSFVKFARLRTFHESLFQIFGDFSSEYSTFRMATAVGFYFLIIHWGACLNVLIPRMVYYREIFDGKTSPCNSSWVWKEEKGLNVSLIKFVSRDIFQAYLFSVYRCLNCLSSIGLDIQTLENVEDKVLAVVLNIVGKLYWIYLLVTFLQMISTLRAGKTRYIEMMSQVDEYMNLRKFPPTLKRKITEYYVYMFQKEYIEENNILKLLSDNLQQEIVLRMHQKLIEKVDMFSGLSPSAIFNIVTCLKPVIYFADDVIFKLGDEGLCMYFISFGTLAVFSATGEEVTHIDDGDYFGEISLITGSRRISTLIAVETTELYCLEYPDFLDSIVSNPVVYSKIEKVALERYREIYGMKDGNPFFKHDTNHLNWNIENDRRKRRKKNEEEKKEDDEDYDDESDEPKK